MTREEIIKELDIDLLDHEKSAPNEMGNVFSVLAEGMENIIELRAGKQNLKEWVEKYRILYGKPFRYDDAEVLMMLGEKDKQLEIAPRPYLDKYLADRCIEKSVIKCRQCLTENNLIYTDLFPYRIPIKRIVELKYKTEILTIENGEYKTDKIIQAWKGKIKDCLIIKVTEDIKVECSKDHKIKLKNGEWIRADKIKIGDELLTVNTIKNKESKVKEIIEIGYKQTYDISVKNKERHSFLAGGIVVSNSEFSENEINENLYLCCNIDYFRVVHLFPTGGMKDTMCKEKIDPAIKFSPNINMLLAQKKSQSLSVKVFNNGSIYRTESSWTETGGRGPSCDKITFDEYESQKPDIEEIYSESTSHSRYGRRSRISTPLVPNMGIDKKYKDGCKFEWMITCPKCKKEQVLRFPDNIINFFDKEGDYLLDDKKYMEALNKVYIGCKYCGAYIERTNDFYLKTSKWVADKPAMVSVHNSYRVTYLMLPWKTGKEILYKYHTFQFHHQFQNEILGVAYVAEDSNIGRAILEANVNTQIISDGKHYGFYKNISIGVDWGGGKIGSWVVVKCQGHPESKKESQVIYIERITKDSLKKLGYKDVSDDGHKYRVEHLIEIFKARICVNDANGIGNDRNQYLIRKFPGKVFGAFYDTAENQKQKTKSKLIEPQWNDNKSIVTVSRLLEFKAILQQFRDLDKVDLPIQTEPVREFIDHINNIIIEKMYDQKSATVYEIVASMGPDHYAHAYLYSNVGYVKLTSKPQGVFIGGFAH